MTQFAASLHAADTNHAVTHARSASRKEADRLHGQRTSHLQNCALCRRHICYTEKLVQKRNPDVTANQSSQGRRATSLPPAPGVASHGCSGQDRWQVCRHARPTLAPRVQCAGPRGLPELKVLRRNLVVGKVVDEIVCSKTVLK